jgi:hypothetical protein
MRYDASEQSSGSEGVWQRATNLLVGVVILCGIGIGIVYLLNRLLHFAVSLDQPLIVAILAASATVLASAITVVVGKAFERKKEIDAHFRQRKFDQADELLKLIVDLTRKQSTNEIDEGVVKALGEFNRNLIIFAGPKTIRVYVWPAPGSEDTELGVFIGPEVSHGETKVYARVQA